MKRPRYLRYNYIDRKATPVRRIYRKVRDGTAVECARAERKLKRNRPTIYKELKSAAKRLRSNSRFRNIIKKGLT